MKDFETPKESREAREAQAEPTVLSAAELQAAAVLSYGVADMPLPASLKERLFEQVAREDAATVLASDLDQQSELFALLSRSLGLLKQQAALMQWQPMGNIDGFEMATWRLDEATESIAFFVRAKTGGYFPLHRHAAGEAVLVLDGDFVVEGRSYGAGDRIDSPAGTSHAPTTSQGCLLLCVSSVNDEILN